MRLKKGKLRVSLFSWRFSPKMSGKSPFVMIRLMDTLIWTDFIAMEEGLKKSFI